MAPGPVTRPPSDPTIPALCSALGLFLLLCGLCALCKRRRKRRKRRMRNVHPNGVALVDVTLLRQTQLRSLSKSDTKLHEIKKPRFGDHQLRPVSMDPLYHSPNWQLPAATEEEDATYSNLNYTPEPLTTSLYESVGSRAEMDATPSESRADEVTDEYAVVFKMKKGLNTGVQQSRKEKDSQTQKPSEEPILPHRPDDLEIEAMYSKVNKKKKTVRDDPRVSPNPAFEPPPPMKMAAVNEIAQGSLNAVLESPPLPAHPPPHPEENLYESICEMSSHAL
ncbi:lck-interacting transmembrane adapter 1 [Rana temporaria]|uniref:lck-interacting transmembrane adapter 1 n=1 Tax=Rana temporaria TaxID=8407 RepID=UPI001AAD12A0|nr:lck-interacting transmembrane adapter 1 [Rana temporaria]